MCIRTISSLLALGLLGAASLIASAPQVKAAPAFCAYYYDGSTNCGFYTFKECLADVSGVGGSCGRNPAYRRSGGQARHPPTRRESEGGSQWWPGAQRW
jgi:hypothetical protein